MQFSECCTLVSFVDEDVVKGVVLLHSVNHVTESEVYEAIIHGVKSLKNHLSVR